MSNSQIVGSRDDASAGGSVARTIDFTVHDSSIPSSSATSSHVLLPGVGVFASGWRGAPRGVAGATASASSMLAA
jgi:hypothetical protein